MKAQLEGAGSTNVIIYCGQGISTAHPSVIGLVCSCRGPHALALASAAARAARASARTASDTALTTAAAAAIATTTTIVRAG